jgi:hypothetical protein
VDEKSVGMEAAAAVVETPVPATRREAIELLPELLPAEGAAEVVEGVWLHLVFLKDEKDDEACTWNEKASPGEIDDCSTDLPERGGWRRNPTSAMLATRGPLKSCGPTCWRKQLQCFASRAWCRRQACRSATGTRPPSPSHSMHLFVVVRLSCVVT